MEEQEKEPYCISFHAVKQRSRFLVGNQAGVEKLAIGTRTDLNSINQGIKIELQKYMELESPQKGLQKPQKKGQTS